MKMDSHRQGASSGTVPEPCRHDWPWNQHDHLPPEYSAADSERMYEALAAVSGLAITLLDTTGEKRLKAGWRRICTQYHRVSPRTCERCTESDESLTARLANGEPMVQWECGNGLMHCAAPVFSGGEHVGNVALSQFLLAPPDEARARALAAEHGFDPDDYWAALNDVSVVKPARLPGIVDFLVETARWRGASLETLERYRQTEMRYATVVAEAADGVFVADAEGILVDVNKSACEMLRRDRAELVGTSLTTLMPGVSAEDLQVRMSSLHPGRGFHHVGSIVRQDGTGLVAEVTAQGLPGGGLMAIGRDITERIQQEEDLQVAYVQAEWRAQETATLAYATKAMHDFDDLAVAGGEVLAACKGLLGAQTGAVLLCGTEDGECDVLVADKEFACLGDTSTPLLRLCEVVHATGEPLHENDMASLCGDSSLSTGQDPVLRSVLLIPILVAGRTEGLMILGDKYSGFSGNDVALAMSFGEIVASGLRHAMATRLLEKSAAEYQDLFNEMLDGFALHEMIFDEDGSPVDYRFLAVNPSFSRLTGLAADDVVGKTVLEVLPGIESRWIEAYGRVVLTGEPAEFEDYVVDLDRYFEIKAYRSSPMRFACVFVDVTERRKAQIALQASEMRRRLAQDAARSGTWEWEVNSGRIAWSHLIWELLDLDPATSTQSIETLWASVLPEDRAFVQATVENATRAGSGFEVEWRVNTRDGSERWLMSRGSPIAGDGADSDLYVGIVIDVTDDRQSADKLKWMRRKLDEAHRVARIGVWEWVVSTDVVTWSQELYRMLGRDLELPAPRFAEMPAFYVQDSWDKLSLVVAQALESAQPYDLELEMLRADGGSCWTRTVGSVMRDREGNIVGLHGTVHDISEQKRAEKDLERHRRRLTELAADLLTNGERERRRIAVELHDGVGQALAAAKMLAQQSAFSGADERNASEMKRLVEMLDFSIDGIRLLTSEISPPVLYELGLGAALEWLADNYSERYALNCDVRVAPEVRGIKTEAGTLLFRSVRELFNNVQRHSGANDVRVAASRRGDTVIVVVEDDGCGFDPASLLDGAGSGERFGLFSIREEVGLAGGTVEIDTEPGRGTRVDIRVPICLRGLVENAAGECVMPG